MNADELPCKATELNAWIRQYFAVFEGPARSYFQLSFPVRVGWPEEERTTQTVHTVSFIALAFLGNEEDCCKCMGATLRMCITHEEFQDQCKPLFIRNWFSFETNEEFGETIRFLYGRIAFWETDINRALMQQACYKPQGAPPRKAVMPKEWCERR